MNRSRLVEWCLRLPGRYRRVDALLSVGRIQPQASTISVRRHVHQSPTTMCRDSLTSSTSGGLLSRPTIKVLAPAACTPTWLEQAKRREQSTLFGQRATWSKPVHLRTISCLDTRKVARQRSSLAKWPRLTHLSCNCLALLLPRPQVCSFHSFKPTRTPQRERFSVPMQSCRGPTSLGTTKQPS
ncbi:unannotated protein [freshwater metagenome]|uniref:Unannotated protein n=1 Tax=freshwater metagenome TaxID=449393 RepID=A0A6J6LJW9_9ZZZZ